MNVLDFFKNNPQVAGSIAKTIPAIVGMNQAARSKKALYGDGTPENPGYINRLNQIEANRQQIVNPYANVTNPFANMQVATKAAEMQMEQTDMALANTLDTLRSTGAAAGGATAIAQAALKSKQGVTANIEKQEMQNQKLAAQGQQRMEQLQGAGEQIQMNMQENRDLRDINRLQVSADMAQQQRASGVSTAALSLGSSLAGLSGLAYKPEANLNDPNSSANLNASADPNAQSFSFPGNDGANTAIRQDMKNMKLEEVPDSPEFDFGNISKNTNMGFQQRRPGNELQGGIDQLKDLSKNMTKAEYSGVLDTLSSDPSIGILSDGTIGIGGTNPYITGPKDDPYFAKNDADRNLSLIHI